MFWERVGVWLDVIIGYSFGEVVVVYVVGVLLFEIVVKFIYW